MTLSWGCCLIFETRDTSNEINRLQNYNITLGVPRTRGANHSFVFGFGFAPIRSRVYYTNKLTCYTFCLLNQLTIIHNLIRLSIKSPNWSLIKAKHRLLFEYCNPTLEFYTKTVDSFVRSTLTMVSIEQVRLSDPPTLAVLSFVLHRSLRNTSILAIFVRKRELLSEQYLFLSRSAIFLQEMVYAPQKVIL